MKIELSPQVVTVDAQHLATLIDVYLTEIAPHVSPSTVKNYRYQLAPFRQWWRGRSTLTPDEGREFVSWLRCEYRNKRGQLAKQNTARTCCRRVRQFLRWLHTSGRLPVDISGWVPMPAYEHKKIRTLSSAEIIRLFDACRGLTRVRDVLLIALMLDTGMRTVEAAGVIWSNIILSADYSGLIWLETVKGYLDHDKRRNVAFSPVSARLLQLYAVFTGAASGNLFGLSTSGIAHVINRVSTAANVEFSAHDLRKTFATYWMLHCATPSPSLAERLLDVQLGHSPRTIAQRHYVGLTIDDVRRYYVSPLREVDLFGFSPQGSEVE